MTPSTTVQKQTAFYIGLAVANKEGMYLLERVRGGVVVQSLLTADEVHAWGVCPCCLTKKMNFYLVL
jgi:hypothetical protein